MAAAEAHAAFFGAAADPAPAGVARALGEIAPLFRLEDGSLAVLMPGVTLHQALRIAQAARRAVDQSAGDGRSQPLFFGAGVAAYHREDDPVSVLCLAERCLDTARASDGSAVVSETDPAIRHARVR